MDAKTKAVMYSSMTAESRLPPEGRQQARSNSNSRLFKLWGAAASSNLADGVFQVGLALLAVQITRSPTAVAGVLLAARLPWLLLTLHAGVIADRMDRLRILAGTSLGRAILIGCLALLTLLDIEHIAVLYVVAFGLGVAETLFDTSVHSLLPRVVEPNKLERANSYMQSAELLMQQFAGPPLGGFLAGMAIWFAFGTSSLIYFAAALLLLWIGGRYQPAQQQIRRSMMHEIREGFLFLWRHSLLRTFAITTGTMNVAFAAVLAVLPLYAVAPGPMGLSGTEYGFLLTGSGIGGLIAAMITTRAETWFGASRLLLISIAGLALGFLIPALTTWPVLVGLGLVITGTCIFWNVVTVSIRQRIVADHLLGRVNASYRLFAYGGLPLGAGIGGLIGQTFGLPAVFVSAAVLVALTLFPIMILASPSRLAAAEAEGARVRSAQKEVTA